MYRAAIHFPVLLVPLARRRHQLSFSSHLGFLVLPLVAAAAFLVALFF
jgi:hypothetical protein